ncbi:MAG TPA: diversity-generating retroelement protein Avd [Saprospirales bacterium]|nr:diversity-generating retroelement protein Avd [Saprospirales bacterium]
MENTKETIVAKAYDLLKHTLPIIEGFPRSQKFTLGDRIQNHLSDLLEMLIEAYYLPAAEKRPALQKVNIKLEQLRYFFRLGFDRGHYNSIRYNEFAQRLDEIGRMVGGWIKSLK